MLCGAGPAAAEGVLWLNAGPWAQTAAFLYQLAMEYHHQGQDDEAVCTLRKVLLVKPDAFGVRTPLRLLARRHALRRAVLRGSLPPMSAAVWVR